MPDLIEIIVPPPSLIEIDQPLSSDDIPALDASKIQSGLLAEARIPATIARDAEVQAAVTSSLLSHVGESDPHPQYSTGVEVATAVNGAIATHLAAPDPHPQYSTAAETQTAITGAIGDHLVSSDPHPQYLTSAEGQAAIEAAAAAAPRVLNELSFVGSTIVTNTPSEVVLHSFTLPVNTLGAVGDHLEMLVMAGITGSTNTKTLRLRQGSVTGTVIAVVSSNVAANISINLNRRIYWLNASSGLFAGAGAADAGPGTTPINPLAIDWNQPQTFVITAQLTVATEAIDLKACSIRTFR